MLSEAERFEVQAMLIAQPELRQEMAQIESALEKYAQANAVEPKASLKFKIESRLSYAVKEHQMGMDDLVMITQHSDYRNWLRLVKDHFPVAFQRENFCEILRDKETAEEGIKQMLVVSSSDIANETHWDVHESFLILKGRCKCTVGSNVFYLEAGGFTEIPLYENHKVEIIAGPVMAIVQYVSVP